MKANIELQVIKSILPRYYQGGEEFYAALPIIDVMMFSTVEKTQQMLDEYEITR